jgi:hypothetical protein
MSYIIFILQKSGSKIWANTISAFDSSGRGMTENKKAWQAIISCHAFNIDSSKILLISFLKLNPLDSL